MALRAISLCAGVGGIDLGLRLADSGICTVCYVEREAFCASVLAARMEDGSLDQAPVWDDVATFDGNPWRGSVDIITAGFPCQPVSLAGSRKGLDDHRFIWDDIARIIDEVGPRYVFLENVPGILTADGGAFLDRVLSALVLLRFDCEWDLFSAEETGAPHKRQRWFCLAVSNAGHQPERSVQHVAGSGWFTSDASETGIAPLAHAQSDIRRPQRHDGRAPSDGPGGHVVHANGAGREEHGGSVAVREEQSPSKRRGGPVADAEHEQRDGTGRAWDRRTEPANGRVYPPARNDHAGWAGIAKSAQPSVCRDLDGTSDDMDPALFAYRNDRLRALGNAVVPLTCTLAWIELNGRMQQWGTE